MPPAQANKGPKPARNPQDASHQYKSPAPAHKPAPESPTIIPGASYFWLGSRVRDPDRMAVVSGAAFSRACCSVTPLCMVERRLLLVRRRASAASKITITPVASNPTRSATATFFLVLEASSDPHQVSGAV